jgi:ABC-type Fe3+-hydroxamate transport system substrate-binding protein
MSFFTDQTGGSISLAVQPKRIISLVPSQTECLADLGLHEEVVGITKFCIHPQDWFRTKIRVGGTKQVNIKLVHELKPDLIIANKEENVKEQVEELSQYYPVWVSDVNNLSDALDMIVSLGTITGVENKARDIAIKIKAGFSRLKIINNKPKTAYLIWKGPYMTAGGDTFIHSMLEACGFENIYKSRLRYPEISIAELQTANCEILLLSSEPYPFSQKHIHELKQYLPDTKILLVNGEMFSWYGSRLLYAPQYFEELSYTI